jgi:hypothetical protein
MSTMKPTSIAVAAILLLLGGCASMSGQKGADQSLWSTTRNNTIQQPGGTSASTSKPINITPLSSFDDEWPKNPAAGSDFAGAYTRLLIYSDIPEQTSGEVEDLQYKGRSLLRRAIVGKEFSVNLSAHITVGTYESTVPLATIGHQSNSSGELWNRVIHHTKADFPLFLVRNDGSASIPSIKIGVTGTKTYTSRGAATAVQVALGVAKATSASASVITKLSEQSTKDKARAVDEAISKLFASGIAEEHWTDRDLRSWNADGNKPRGVKVEFMIPGDEEDWNSPKQIVGTWTITFDFPRPSIFADWRICGDSSMPRCVSNPDKAIEKIHKSLDPGEVLNYMLVNGGNSLGTVKSFLSQQDWYVSAQSALADKAKVKEAAGGLCRRIKNEITGLGLNGLDSEIVLWAVVNGMPLPSGVNFSQIDDCMEPLNTIAEHRKNSGETIASAR